MKLFFSISLFCQEEIFSHLHLPVLAGWSSFKISKAVNGFVNVMVDLITSAKPGAHGHVLPNSHISRSGVDQEGDGSNTDLWMLRFVKSN